ncbi:uncharacterized protein LOC125369587 [Ricinus communis]|uniref:uncharacterized protein LOC125369587 n=1 Tax=Ricinus communis TaxID=3988 RepID=UPI00201B1F12|nr:uncharacterized protein LOC125369587 [Ricinus communis]
MEETNNSTPTSPSSPSFKQKLKHKYIACLPSAFRRNNNHNQNTGSLPSSPAVDSENSSAHPKQPTLIRTSSIDKCKNFITRIGRNAQGLTHGHGQSNGHAHSHGRGHRRRHSLSANFRYDAMSYALNFDEGNDESVESEYHLRSFSSRLPQSPKREIVCS